MNNVVVRFCPWFKFYFLLFLVITTYDNEFETKENTIYSKDKIEQQHAGKQLAGPGKLSQEKNDVEAMWSPVP